MGPLKQDYSCVSFISVIFVGRLFCIFCVSKDMRSVSNSQRGGEVRVSNTTYLMSEDGQYDRNT